MTPAFLDTPPEKGDIVYVPIEDETQWSFVAGAWVQMRSFRPGRVTSVHGDFECDWTTETVNVKLESGRLVTAYAHELLQGKRGEAK